MDFKGPEMRQLLQVLTSGFDPSLKSNHQLLIKLHKSLQDQDVPVQLIVLVVRSLARLLVYYQTTPFRETVLSILRTGLISHGEKVLDAILDEIKKVAEFQMRIVNPSRSESGRSLLTLSWAILLSETCKDKDLSLRLAPDNSKWQSLLSFQGALFYGACASKTSSIEKSARRKLMKLWKMVGKDCVNLYVDTIVQSEANSTAIGLLGALASVYPRKFCSRKEDFVKLYVKLIISARTKPLVNLLSLSKPAVRFVDHEDLKSTLLPSIQKSLLRNAENILPVVFELFDAVSVDLSVHANVILKSLTAQLVSKEDSCRQLANRALVSMGKQMSDADAVQEVVKSLMGLLKGSEGKLTLPGQKMDIITSIGGLCQCAVSSGPTRAKLIGQVVDHLATLLQDTHEPTVILTLSCIGDWCKQFQRGTPDNVFKLAKTGLAAKNVSSMIKAAYMECVLDILIKDHVEKAGTLSDLLFGIIDKARTQPNRPPIVHEGLCAAHLIIALEGADYTLDALNLKKLQETIANDELQLFTSSKFVSQVEVKGLQRLALFCGNLLVWKAEKLDEKAMRMYCSALIQLLLHESYLVRKTAFKTVRNIQESSPVETFDMMLTEFQAIIKDREGSSDQISNEYDDEEAIKRRLVQQRFSSAMSLLLRIPDVQSFKTGATTRAINAMLTCHHPFIVAVRGDIWTDFLFKLDIDALGFIEKHCDDIMKLCASAYEENQGSVKNALSNLARIAPKCVMSSVLITVKPILQDPAVVSVSEADFQIMHFPKNLLWNKDIIKSTSRIAENKNIKRENKMYSHKEQMEFLQLQKEIEAKKSKDKRNANPGANYGFEQTLTKKQIELVEAELKKEAAIRDNLLQVDKKMRMAIEYLISCISQSNCQSLEMFIPDLVELVLPLVSSHIASELAQSLLLIMKNIVDCDALHRISLQIVYANLRLYCTSHDIPHDWNAEDLNVCVSRLTRILYDRSKIGGKDTLSQVPFSSACFCFLYPILKKMLDGSINGVEIDDKLIVSALKIIKVHADRAPGDDFGAKALLCADMLQKIKIFIEQNEGSVRNLACDVFVSTCQAIAAAYESYTEVSSEIEILAECLLSSTAALRRTALKGFKSMINLLPKGSAEDATTKMLTCRLWISCYDLDEDASEMAEEIWRDLSFTTSGSLCFELLDIITNKDADIQEAAADALYSALESNLASVLGVLTSLMDLYNLLYKQIPVSVSRVGVRTVQEEVFDEYFRRVGVAKALEKIGPSIPEDMVEKLFSFYVGSALKDPKAEVRSAMLQAALQAVEAHGKTCTDDLMTIFQNFLKQAPDAENFDAVRQSVVILLGTLAHHLDKDDPRVKPIFAKLTETLSTPSQQVQEAVAKCLTPLVPAIKADAPEIVKKLLLVLLGSENYGERKGAAYGLAGITKGLGIIAFKQLDIMNTLTDAIQDKKNYRHREGALLAFEMFCVMLGRLFEPYIVHVLPYLLLCFGDGNQYVREAADDTARAVMRNLSAHGVKLVLPSLLSALAEDSWRTKTGSVELLGAMAFCAPKQLSACLPSVVPQLCNVLTDSHPKVQKAGHQALKQIGSVIRNPEIQKITSALLAALAEPFRNTSKCLQTLLDTKFVHVIDAPSLALIMPVVNRAFEDRSTDTRRMAAQIIGNMYSLTEQKDLKPYLASVIPGLKTSLLDPVPEVRNDAARALGAIVRGTGEQLYEELLPWLMDTLTSERSSVDRGALLSVYKLKSLGVIVNVCKQCLKDTYGSEEAKRLCWKSITSGAAQGIAEVLGALGVGKLEGAMPDIVKMASSSEVLPHVRDGYIMLYIYLPVTFEKEFTPFIGDIIPALLKSLADECEFLRDTALVAGQCIISKYAEEAVPLLLPQLEQGMFDENWRIRLSSIQLLGELLYQVSGVTGKMSTHGEDDDNFGTMEGQKAIQSVLGEKRCHRVFSGLYIGRSDVMLQVRQSALHIWKIVVPNTPRVLREILPTLFEILLRCSASASYDKRQVAAKTMGDIVKKLGERMLPEIIPILDHESNSKDDDQRQGVCIALAEIISSCTKDAVLAYADQLIPTIKRGLSDENKDVSTAAATTFQNLHSAIGNQALEEIIPALLNQLDDSESSEHLIHGLREVIALKGRVVMPFIVPKLIQPPVNTHILAVLSSVAGESLTKHLSKILKALLSGLVAAAGEPDEYSTTLKNCQDVILSVEGEHGNRIIMDDLIKYTKSEDVGERLSATALLTAFCQSSEYDYSSYVAMFIQVFFKLLADKEVSVQEQAWSALSVLIKRLDAAEQLQHVGSLRQAMRYSSDEIKRCGGLLPGFCNPKKGMAPVLPILREGILNGAPDTKEQSAKALSECIELLTSQALKPSVISITGPLIRILGDRFNPKVRSAVLETLTLLLAKAGAFLKPFLPQLQTTFSKALHDADRPVRLQAAKGLRNLVAIHARLDPLFLDLNNSIKAETDPSIMETTLHALRCCIDVAGSKMSQKIRTEIIATLDNLMGSDEESCSKCAAGCLGSLSSSLDDDELENFLEQNVYDVDPSWNMRLARSTLLMICFKQNPVRICEKLDKVLPAVLEYANLERVEIVNNSLRCAAYILIFMLSQSQGVPNEVLKLYRKASQHTSNDVKIFLCDSISYIYQTIEAKNSDENSKVTVPLELSASFVSLLLTFTKEKNTTVRSSMDIALVRALDLTNNDNSLQRITQYMNSRDIPALNDLAKSRLKKLATTNPTVEDIDFTLVKF